MMASEEAKFAEIERKHASSQKHNQNQTNLKAHANLDATYSALSEPDITIGSLDSQMKDRLITELTSDNKRYRAEIA